MYSPSSLAPAPFFLIQNTEKKNTGLIKLPYTQCVYVQSSEMTDSFKHIIPQIYTGGLIVSFNSKYWKEKYRTDKITIYTMSLCSKQWQIESEIHSFKHIIPEIYTGGLMCYHMCISKVIEKVLRHLGEAYFQVMLNMLQLNNSCYFKLVSRLMGRTRYNTYWSKIIRPLNLMQNVIRNDLIILCTVCDT